MEYLTRTEGPAAYGTRLGVRGILHATDNGRYTNDTLFECVVDNGIGTADGWGVVGIFSPIVEGKPTGNNTMVVFGTATGTPFASFQDAFAFCQAFSKQLYDREVDTRWMGATINERSIMAQQWLTLLPAEVAGETRMPPRDPLPGELPLDGEGDTCDVAVAVPAGRVLH